MSSLFGNTSCHTWLEDIIFGISKVPWDIAGCIGAVGESSQAVLHVQNGCVISLSERLGRHDTERSPLLSGLLDLSQGAGSETHTDLIHHRVQDLKLKLTWFITGWRIPKPTQTEMSSRFWGKGTSGFEQICGLLQFPEGLSTHFVWILIARRAYYSWALGDGQIIFWPYIIVVGYFPDFLFNCWCLMTPSVGMFGHFLTLWMCPQGIALCVTSWQLWSWHFVEHSQWNFCVCVCVCVCVCFLVSMQQSLLPFECEKKFPGQSSDLLWSNAGASRFIKKKEKMLKWTKFWIKFVNQHMTDLHVISIGPWIHWRIWDYILGLGGTHLCWANLHL